MKIKVVPTGQELEGDPNRSLMQICHDNQIPIASICKGVPSCAECRIRITAGEYNVLPPTTPEIKLIGTSYHLDGRRLSCQVRCFGDITIDIAEQMDRAKNQKRKTRGFHWAGSKNQDSTAVQDTLIFEKPVEGAEAPATEPKPQAPRKETSGREDSRGGGGSRNSRGSRRGSGGGGSRDGHGGGGGGGPQRDSGRRDSQRNPPPRKP